MSNGLENLPCTTQRLAVLLLIFIWIFFCGEILKGLDVRLIRVDGADDSSSRANALRNFSWLSKKAEPVIVPAQYSLRSPLSSLMNSPMSHRGAYCASRFMGSV